MNVQFVLLFLKDRRFIKSAGISTWKFYRISQLMPAFYKYLSLKIPLAPGSEIVMVKIRVQKAVLCVVPVRFPPRE